MRSIDCNLYLIQRASIVHPLADDKQPLSKAVRFDYMGSAEFEFGALPASFRRYAAHAGDIKSRTTPLIKDGESSLRTYSYMSDDDHAKYLEKLLKLREAHKYIVRLKEVSHFNLEERQTFSQAPRTDFWWDIEFDVMFGFDKTFMNRLPDYVKNSLFIVTQNVAK